MSQSERIAELDRLLRDFCGALSVQPLQDGSFSLATPFLFGDGDALPIIAEHSDDGWRLTDRGGAAAHLFFDDIELTEARMNALGRLAGSDGCELDNSLVLAADLDAAPSAYDLADFIQAVAHIGAIAGLERRQPYQWYVTQVREEVETWVPEQSVERQWTPPEDTVKAYRADLKITAPQDVVIFIAGTDDKADRSALTARMYKDWEVPVIPVAAYNPATVTSASVTHLQDFVGDQAVVPVEPGDYMRFRRALADVGVSL